MKKMLIAGAATMLAMPASAATIVLDFEGVGNTASVNDFYNGGTDSAGNSGIDYGINFTPVSLGLIDSDAGGSGNIANEPSGETALFFLDGGAATMNVAAGFDTGFSFFYSSAQPGGFVTVYDGLDGTGNVLAMLDLAVQANDGCVGDPNGFYCNWDPIGVAFAGTAMSVDFGGVANFIVFDNITLGAATPGGAVPEPATWAFMILGFGAIGGALRRNGRRQRKANLKVSYA